MCARTCIGPQLVHDCVERALLCQWLHDVYEHKLQATGLGCHLHGWREVPACLHNKGVLSQLEALPAA